MELIQTEEGRITRSGTTYTYHYFLRDHLGNNRVGFAQGTNVTTPNFTADYYPFGLQYQSDIRAGSPINNYLYNGKEYQNGLKLYDYGARLYDPVIARWNVVDPMAEYMRKHSVYNYAMNNPLRLTDPTGTAPDDPINGGTLPVVTITAPPSSNFSDFGDFLWGAVDFVPFAGSIKQIGTGIYNGDIVEASLGVVFLGVDIFTGGEGGEALRLAEEGAESLIKVAAKDEVREIAEKNLDEIAETVSKEVKSVDALRSAKETDAHHIIQDAAARDLPGYNSGKAPGVKLEGPPQKAGTPHNNATLAQRISNGYRRGNYARERVIAYKALKDAGFSDAAAKSMVREADKYFQSIGVNMQTITRIPGR